ncbi:MAG TPA: TonB family protein [Ferruginibacter sp.]|nr:TonB family protein [Ferruginibacter sp.]
MNGPDKNNYTLQDIEKYHAGKLLPKQMHEMEKAALDDPFLADAMEGYEMFKNEDLNKQLVTLYQQVAEKGKGAKVIPLHKSNKNWWKAIAAILIIGAGLTTTYLLTKKNNTSGIKETQIASVKTVIPDTSKQIETQASVTVSVNPNASNNKEDLAKQVTTKTKPSELSSQDAVNKQTETAITEPTANPVKSEEGNKTASTPVSESVGVNRDQTQEIVKTSKKQVSKAVIDDESIRNKIETASTAKKESILNNFFTAQIISADNTALPFTNISVKKDNFGTYADAKGMLRLISTDSVLQVELKSVGYLPKTVTIYNNQPQTKIVLQEDASEEKNSMVVRSSNAASPQPSRRAILLSDSTVNIEPADGWDKYNTYVANNLDIPEEMIKRDIHGEVELSFDVKKNGTISNIKVSKSLGAQYDEAAKRLLMEGPQWKVKKGKKSSVSVKVKF